MARLYALDQNFPQPIVDSLRDWLEADAELTPIAEVHPDMATLDDWQVLPALHTDERPWDGLITTDARMLNLPRELAVLCQTKLRNLSSRMRRFVVEFRISCTFRGFLSLGR